MADGPRWPHAPIDWLEQEDFSQPWMVRWLEAAASSLSVTEACRQAGIGLGQYLLARRLDRAFDRAALVFDQIVDLMIQESVRLQALDGDLTAARLYYAKVRRPAFIPPFVSWIRPEPDPTDEPLPPHVVEAMLAAATEALNRPPPDAAGGRQQAEPRAAGGAKTSSLR